MTLITRHKNLARHPGVGRGFVLLLNGIPAFAGIMTMGFLSTSAFAEETAHGTQAGAEHGSSGLPQFNPEWFPSQIFWLAITFGILYFFFARITLPRIAGTLEARQEKIAADMAEAERLTQSAQATREDFERELAKAQSKAAASIRAIDDKVKEKTNDLLYSFRTKFTAEIARAEFDLARERDRLGKELNDMAAETAAHAASKILQAPADLEHAQQVVETLHNAKAA